METFEVGQPVVVYAGRGKDRRHDGVITDVGRKLVTIEWWGHRFSAAKKFRIEDQCENLPPSRTYAYSASFRTLEQDALARRQHAAENGLARVGLRKSSHKSLTLEEMEAVVKLLDGMRETS